MALRRQKALRHEATLVTLSPSVVTLNEVKGLRCLRINSAKGLVVIRFFAYGSE